MNETIYIAVDFDGTVVTHDYPKVGETVPNAVEVLKELQDKGYKMILYTMRSDDKLQDAVNWFKSNNVELYGVNENPSQKTWTKSTKVYAHRYIDDAAIGAYLIHNSNNWLGKNFPVHKRPYVNWRMVREEFVDLGLLPEKP